MQVGLLSSKTRLVRVKNVLTEQEDLLEVPSEETVGQVCFHSSSTACHTLLQRGKSLHGSTCSWGRARMVVAATVLVGSRGQAVVLLR